MLSPSELLLAAKTHVAYINLQDNVVDKFTLPEEKPVKSEDEVITKITLQLGLPTFTNNNCIFRTVTSFHRVYRT